MPRLIQIRDLPDESHGRLKAKAALEGRTLAEYLRRELVALAERPSDAELWDRVAARPPVVLDEPPALTIRRERDARER